MTDYYGTLVQADAYHEARGNAAWTGVDSAREAALLRASVWLDATYRTRFPGYKTGRRAQVREWPRSDAADVNGEYIPFDEVPAEVLNATFEAALRELTEAGALSPDFVAANHVVSESVGPISTTYRDNVTMADVRPMVHVVADILSGLIGDPRDVSMFGHAGRT